MLNACCANLPMRQRSVQIEAELAQMHPSLHSRQDVVRRGKRLEVFTIAWNSLEGLVGIAAGAIAGSISLVGFGIDSFIEVISGLTLLWRMSVDHRAEGRERSERLSLRIVGLCFLALAGYVTYKSISDIISRHAPQHSVPGIILACCSLAVMPLLSRAKKNVGRALGSVAMHADARQTDFCVYLSAILLIGLVLNAALGWWWTDPIAGLLMVPLIAKEGVAGLTGKACCCVHDRLDVTTPASIQTESGAR
jgi:divalent metal cation (Fe/Co/Zn/Cd) transporter